MVIVLHGSPRKSANLWEPFRRYLVKLLGMADGDVLLSYLQFGEPSVGEALRRCLEEGARRIIIHPLFLSSGQHVIKDLPQILESFKQDVPEVDLILTPPIGQDERLAEIVKERIEEARPYTGKSIEEESFRIIERECNLSVFSFEEREIVKRVIHATADLEFAETMIFHPKAIEVAQQNLQAQKKILVDVEMVRAGISKAFYSKERIICYLNHVSDDGIGTRSEKAIELALEKEEDIGLLAIGNSPTALLKVIEVLNKKERKDVVVVGLPVGFVKALSAKLLLAKQDFPYITNLSRKGGSPATCAVVNALLRLTFQVKDDK